MPGALVGSVDCVACELCGLIGVLLLCRLWAALAFEFDASEELFARLAVTGALVEVVFTETGVAGTCGLTVFAGAAACGVVVT